MLSNASTLACRALLSTRSWHESSSTQFLDASQCRACKGSALQCRGRAGSLPPSLKKAPYRAKAEREATLIPQRRRPTVPGQSGRPPSFPKGGSLQCHGRAGGLPPSLKEAPNSVRQSERPPSLPKGGALQCQARTAGLPPSLKEATYSTRPDREACFLP